MEQCGESFTFQCNDIFIFDGRQPFRAALSNDGFRALAVLPRDMIDWRALAASAPPQQVEFKFIVF
jgi:hypothetical protein